MNLWITSLLLSCMVVFLAFNIVNGQVLSLFDQTLITAIDEDFNKNSKYNFIPLTTYDDFEYTVHEYKTSDNQVGYQIIKFYNDKTVSIGTGKEFDSRTFTIDFETHIATSTL